MPVRPKLVFSHANGFPGACYRKLYEFLDHDFDIHYVDRFGHDPRYPVTDGWPHLVAQLLDFIVACADGPVVGAGHSLGGYLTVLAATLRPELFSAVILLDSPLPGPWAGTALELVKRFGLIDRVTPAALARERRTLWTSAEAVYQHFQARAAFRHFDPNCLRDYANFGTVTTVGGVRLAFDPDVESRIYCTIPHDLAQCMQGFKVPSGFIGGRQSVETGRIGLSITRRYFHVNMIDGGHLLPFEHPRTTANAVHAMWQRLVGTDSPADGRIGGTVGKH